MDCDLYIELVPSSFGKVLTLLVNYENPEDVTTEMTHLPTWNNKPAWSASLKTSSIIRIEGAEPYFFEHHGMKSKQDESSELKPESKGYYYIGIQSEEAVRYTINVYTKPHNSLEEDGVASPQPVMDFDHVYLGAQDHDIFLQANQTKYFYFQNWMDETLKFSLDILNSHFNTPN